MTDKHKLSIMIPCYNEEQTIKKIIKRILAIKIPNFEKEIIVIDDASKDNSARIINTIKGHNIKKVFLKKNLGKGGAIKEGLKHVKGDFVIFQDADLEYDPADYKKLLNVILPTKNVVVLGNRFTKENRKYILKTLAHYIANRILAALFSILYLQYVPDAEPCYKLFRTKDLLSVKVHSNRFEYDIELMCKLAKKGYKFVSPEIAYAPRSVKEGKKIRWTDGLIAVKVMLFERFTSN